MKSLAKDLIAQAKSQSGCTTCALGCPTAKSVQQFPKNIQDKIDGIVARMNLFRQACEKEKVSCSGNREPRLTKEIVGSFADIVRDYQSLVVSHGKTYPNLKESLDYMISLHSNDVFEYLVKKARK